MKLLAAFGLAVVMLVNAAPAGARDRCARPGSKTLAADSTTRAYAYRGALYGCERRIGRHRVLADAPEEDADYVERWRRPVRVRGRYVAWLTHIDYICAPAGGCPADDPGFSTSIDIADVRTGSRSTPGYEGTLDRFFIGPTGSLVYVMRRGGQPELWVTDGGGTRRLDTGAVGGLLLRGTSLTWTNQGQLRGAYVAGGTTCEPREQRVRAWNDVVRVYDRGAHVTPALYGCVWRRSRPIRLTSAPHANVEAAGRFAAWSEPGTVVVRDLVRGREVRPPAGAVLDVALGGDGVVAWLEDDGRLLATRGTIPIELARDAIEAGSLAVRSGVVAWRQAGAERSAPAPG